MENEGKKVGVKGEKKVRMGQKKSLKNYDHKFLKTTRGHILVKLLRPKDTNESVFKKARREDTLYIGEQ